MVLKQTILESLEWICWVRDGENRSAFLEIIFKFRVSGKAGNFYQFWGASH
jgi:hypothetical protein